jgi:hypothetical protein
LTEHGGGWGLVASPVFKTGVTRPSRVGWVRFPHSPAIALVLAVTFSSPAIAQRIDSTQVAAKPQKLARITECLPIPVDTTAQVTVPSVIIGPVAPKSGPPPCRVPISPGSAFLRSFLLPGAGQMKLARKKAATVFIVAEVGTVAMSIKSWSDLAKAKNARDTVPTPVLDDQGQPVIDSVTNEPKVTYAPKNKNLADRVKARRTHLEDWLAAMIFNHLFSGADAFVAANLADFNTNVQAEYTDRRVRVLARIAW